MTDPQADYLDELAASLRMANARIDRLERDRLDALLGVGTPGRSGIDLSAGEPVPGDGPFEPTALIQAGAVMAESVVVGLRSGAGSLVVNGGFEDGAQFAYGIGGAVPGWESADVAPGSGVVGTDARIAAGSPHSGVQHIQIRRTAGADRVTGTMLFPVMPGRKIYISGWYWCDSGPTTAGVAIEWYTAAGVHTATDGNFPAVAADSTYRQSSGTFVVPTTAAYARVVVGTFGTNGAVVYDDVIAYYADDRLENGSGSVTIDASGITILDGALTIEDEFGATVAGATGFTGGWADFIATGLYNSGFQSGVFGTVPNGRTSALPYWTVSRVGSPTITSVAGAMSVVHNALLDTVTIKSDRVRVRPSGRIRVGIHGDVSGGTETAVVKVYEYTTAGTLSTSNTILTQVGIVAFNFYESVMLRLGVTTAYVAVEVTVSNSQSARTFNLDDVVLSLADGTDSEESVAAANVTLTTAAQNLNVLTVHDSSKIYLVIGTFDFEVTVAGVGVCIGELWVNGVAVSGQALFSPATTGRVTVSKTWRVPSNVASNNKFELFVYKTINAGSAKVNATHSLLQSFAIS